MPDPHDSLEVVVNLARVRLLDMVAAVGGDVLTDTQPFTVYAVNAAWRKMQEFLSKLGFRKFHNDITLTGVAAVGSPNPGSEPYISWTGYWDGAAMQVAPVLPQDLICPKELRERLNGTGSIFLEMDFLDGEPPLVPKAMWNRIWGWRNEQLRIPGSLTVTDLWVSYWSYAPDFVPAATSPFASQKVPIMRCAEAFSWYLVAELGSARGDLDVQKITGLAEEAATILVGRENPGVLAPAAAPPPQPQAGA